MQNEHIYALLIGVGDYRRMNTENLSSYQNDAELMKTALVSGLRVPGEHIRIMTGEDENGLVTVSDFAKSIASFRKLLSEEDTFVLYFSGHGMDQHLVYSDGLIALQSVIDFAEKLPAKNKLVLLDCCYSGDFRAIGAKKLDFEQSLSDFVGHGIAIMASSAADEVSRLGEDGTYSLFTDALATAMVQNRRKRNGCLSLYEWNEEVQSLVNGWNRRYPERAQHPVFRSSMGGTIYFPVENKKTEKPQKVLWETEHYKVVQVKDFSTRQIKRLSAFVVCREHSDISRLPQYTKEIAGKLQARGVWCHFGADDRDIQNSLYYAYTICAADAEVKKLYFRENAYAQEIQGIYVWENSCYEMLKKMQEPSMTREEFILTNKKLLALIVSKAEAYIVDLQEVANRTMDLCEMQKRYKSWNLEVKKLYLELTDGDIAPEDLHDWSEEILNLAGWVLDLGLWLEQKQSGGEMGIGELWLIKQSIGKYYGSLEKLKEITLNE